MSTFFIFNLHHQEVTFTLKFIYHKLKQATHTQKYNPKNKIVCSVNKGWAGLDRVGLGGRKERPQQSPYSAKLSLLLSLYVLSFQCFPLFPPGWGCPFRLSSQVQVSPLTQAHSYGAPGMYNHRECVVSQVPVMRLMAGTAWPTHLPYIVLHYFKDFTIQSTTISGQISTSLCDTDSHLLPHTCIFYTHTYIPIQLHIHTNECV